MPDTTQPTSPNEAPASLALGSGSVIYCVAVLLQRYETDGSVSTTQTISWRGNCTEEEAKGSAATYAFANKPGFSIAMMTVAKIEITSPNTNDDRRRTP